MSTRHRPIRKRSGVMTVMHEDYDAIGLVEIKYFTHASHLLDAMLKGANVRFVSSENALGGRLVTLVVGGGIEQIQAALAIAEEKGQALEAGCLVNTVMIAQPSEDIMNYLGEYRSIKGGEDNE